MERRRRRGQCELDRQAFGLCDVVLPYGVNALSNFERRADEGLESVESVRKRGRLAALREMSTHYARHPFVETDNNLIVRDLTVNTFGPFGSGFEARRHEIVFEYRGIGVLRNSRQTEAVVRDAGERVDDDDAVLVGGRRYCREEFKRRDKLWQRLRVDFGIPDHRKPPHRSLVTCVSLSTLNRHLERYADVARLVRDCRPDSDTMTASRFQQEVVQRSRRAAADGGEFDAPAVEAMLCLLETPTDLFDVFRPLGVCHNGDPVVRGHPDRRRDLLQVLVGGEGRLLLPSDDDGGYEREDGAASPSMCSDAWLVYRQKSLLPPSTRRNSGVDVYPGLELHLTEKPRGSFVRDFLARENYSSLPTRGRPGQPSPFVFAYLGTTLENTHGEMGGDEVVQFQAGLAIHQRAPVVIHPSLLKPAWRR